MKGKLGPKENHLYVDTLGFSRQGNTGFGKRPVLCCLSLPAGGSRFSWAGLGPPCCVVPAFGVLGCPLPWRSFFFWGCVMSVWAPSQRPVRPFQVFRYFTYSVLVHYRGSPYFWYSYPEAECVPFCAMQACGDWLLPTVMSEIDILVSSAGDFNSITWST